MARVLVTGGTGLIGSNICEQLLARDDEVAALVREGSDAAELEALGVAVVRGDITDPADVRRAAEGCQAAIHSAAVLGGASQDPELHRRVNLGGVTNVLDAAEQLGMRKVVTLGTTTYFDFETAPLSESSPLHPNPAADPYTQTKRAAFVEAMRRADAGLDVSVVIPGGTFGPAPCVARSMEAPSYNLRIVLTARGEFDEAVRFPIPWSFAPDVAAVAVAALDQGIRGRSTWPSPVRRTSAPWPCSSTGPWSSPGCPSGSTRSPSSASTPIRPCGSGSGPASTPSPASGSPSPTSTPPGPTRCSAWSPGPSTRA